jgi:hypothetical protein
LQVQGKATNIKAMFFLNNQISHKNLELVNRAVLHILHIIIIIIIMNVSKKAST